MLRFLTSGESHGKCLLGILEGMPAGIKLKEAAINKELSRRQKGYGRGGRMKIEKDKVKIVSGMVKGETNGAPVGLIIENRDFRINKAPELFRPRPGHADLTGALKYDAGIRAVLERASARETAMRVAVGAVCKTLMGEFGVKVISHVIQIGRVGCDASELDFAKIAKLLRGKKLNCCSSRCDRAMALEIDEAKKRGDTLGGIFEVRAAGLPVGLGSHVHYDRRLDARISGSVMSIPAVKAVGFGLAWEATGKPGSEFHDEICYKKSKGFGRESNRAGGLEGGITTGEELVVKAVMKPIATLKKPLASVNMRTKKKTSAGFERSDVCAVPSAGIVGEAMVSFELARAFLGKFGSDSLGDIRKNYELFRKRVG